MHLPSRFMLLSVSLQKILTGRRRAKRWEIPGQQSQAIDVAFRFLWRSSCLVMIECLNGYLKLGNLYGAADFQPPLF
ncbi:hypothetical protein HDK64DRAFT_3210 [Phyllosticta capitalensis]